MGKFAAKLLLFAVIFLIYDKLFILVSNRSAEVEIDKRLEYLLKGEINKDIIIAGSSRGSRNIIAGQIEDSTGLSSYNLCYPGSTVEFHEFILRTLVRFNRPPEFVFLVVDDNSEFLYDETIIFRKDLLHSLVKYSYIRDELVKLGDKEKFLSDFLVLNRLNKTNFYFREKRFTPLDSIVRCGSMPISWRPEGLDISFDSSERVYPADKELPEKVNAFKEIIETCKTNNIELIIVFPPNYQNHSRSFEDRIRQISGDEVYYYVYNEKNPIYKNEEYYHDESHLMRNGAIIFTNEIVRFLDRLTAESGYK